MRKPQRQVNSDPAPGNRESRASALTGCLTLLLPPLANAQGAPHQLYSGKRPGRKLIRLHLPAPPSLPARGFDGAPVPNSHFSPSYSLACPASIPSPLAQPRASGSQLGVTGSPDSWQEVGVGWLQVYRGGTDIRRAGEHARCYGIGRFRKRETWRRWRLDSSLRQ